MILNILAIGDVTGESGVEFLFQHLRSLQKLKNIHFTVANGENTDGNGFLPRQAESLFDAGVDVITLGNHAFQRKQSMDFLEKNTYILRPDNWGRRLPGRGCGVYSCKGIKIAVLNLVGRCGMTFGPDNPFDRADSLLSDLDADVILVDFHAEATSEKLALYTYLDGRVSALWGTHTHVPTADEQVSGKGTGYQTDLGMTGPIYSVLGIRPEQSVALFRCQEAGRFEVAPGPCKMEGTVFSVETETGKCIGVERVSLRD